jgi:hypothetical protein
MNTEKEKYLRVATPDEWDYWLTLQADHNAPKRKGGKMNWATREINAMGFMSCLFCKTFNRNCLECMGNQFGCFGIPGRLKVDKAIERLEKVGIWD